MVLRNKEYIDEYDETFQKFQKKRIVNPLFIKVIELCPLIFFQFHSILLN